MLQKIVNVAKMTGCCKKLKMLQKGSNVAILLECCIVSFTESFAKKAVLYGLLFSLGREERSPTPATKEAILRSSAG